MILPISVFGKPTHVGETFAGDIGVEERLLPAVGFFDHFTRGVFEGAGVVNFGAEELGGALRLLDAMLAARQAA